MAIQSTRSLSRFVPSLGRSLRVWPLIDLFRQRQALSQLTDHELRDIGVSPIDARKEAARPVWDVPDHWKR